MLSPVVLSNASRQGWLLLHVAVETVEVQVIEVWVKILQAVPSARFLLKNKPFACPAAREHVLQLFVKKGVAAHRIDLLPLAPANAGQMHLHHWSQ